MSLLVALLKTQLRDIGRIQLTPTDFDLFNPSLNNLGPVWVFQRADFSAEHCSAYKAATLVHKFLHSGFPMYCAAYLSSYNCSYCTRCSQRVCVFIVRNIHQYNQKSVNQFCHSFAFDAHTVWAALPDEIRAPPLRMKLESYLTPRYATLILSISLVYSVVLGRLFVPGYCCRLTILVMCLKVPLQRGD